MKKILAAALFVALTVACSPSAPKIDVIFDSDVNNELDDQHAITYLLMNPETFNTLGITTNKTYNGGNIALQAEEANRVLALCGKWGEGIPVFDGAESDFVSIKDHIGEASFDGSDAVNFIIATAKRYTPDTKLTLIAVGKATNVALALMKSPEITPNIRLVWLGTNYPDNRGEYNMGNDVPSANYIFDSDIECEIVTVRNGRPSGTDAVRVTKEFVEENFAGKGPKVAPVTGRHGGEFTCFGDYSVNLFNHIHLENGTRALFDLCAPAIVKNPEWAQTEVIPAPTFVDGKWVERPDNPRKVMLWENFDKEAIVGDFIATLEKTSE